MIPSSDFSAYINEGKNKGSRCRGDHNSQIMHNFYRFITLNAPSTFGQKKQFVSVAAKFRKVSYKSLNLCATRFQKKIQSYMNAIGVSSDIYITPTSYRIRQGASSNNYVFNLSVYQYHLYSIFIDAFLDGRPITMNKEHDIFQILYMYLNVIDANFFNEAFCICSSKKFSTSLKSFYDSCKVLHCQLFRCRGHK